MTGLRVRQRKLLAAGARELAWRRWSEDPVAFFRECVWIPAVGTKQGRLRFDLFDYQADTLDRFLQDRYVIVLKARQLGLTTLAMSYALWLLLFRPGTNILLVSKDQRTADKALDMLDFMWGFMPASARATAPVLEIDANREHVWRFPDGMTSRIVSLPATKTAGAGETATLVLWDEAALVTEQDDTLRTLMPTTDAGGSMIVFSTARGSTNRFARMFREAQAGESQFTPIFHPWTASRLINRLADEGGVDETVYAAKKREFSAEPWRFFAEYPSSVDEAFRQSGRTRFPGLPEPEMFEDFGWRGRLECPRPDVYRLVQDPAGPLRLDTEMLNGLPSDSSPVVAIDPAGGVGGDFTVMTLGYLDDEGLPRRVGVWRDNQTEPVEAARQAALLGRWGSGRHREAEIVVERAGGYGESTVQQLRDEHGYANLYVHIKAGHRKHVRESMVGFPMSYSKRPLVIDRLAEWLPDTNLPDKPHMLGIDTDLRVELGAFVQRADGRLAADNGAHDDLVMSCALWLYVLLGHATSARQATPEPTGEQTQTFNLEEALWKPAREAWLAQERENMRSARRAGRRRSRR